MVRRLARLRFGVVAAAAIAIGMILVPTSGTAFAAQAAFARPAAAPAAQTYILLTVENAGGIEQSEWICSSGLHNLGSGSAGDVIIADNGCNGRLWLHRLANGTGATYCINPHTQVDPPPAYQATLSITASANGAKCLS
jgi:hypothetical protein